MLRGSLRAWNPQMADLGEPRSHFQQLSFRQTVLEKPRSLFQQLSFRKARLANRLFKQCTDRCQIVSPQLQSPLLSSPDATLSCAVSGLVALRVVACLTLLLSGCVIDPKPVVKERLVQQASRVKPWSNSSAIDGKVVWVPAKSIWYTSMLIAGLIGGALYFSWAAVAVFLFLSALTLCLGTSVGMHRLLIRRSFETPRWLEQAFVYLGLLVGMAGPIGMFRIHALRDWQQNQPDCHSFAKHDAGFWRDAFWRVHCRQVKTRPPDLHIEDRVMGDKFYQWLEATWRWQQIPLAIVLYAVGGWGFVFWGVFAGSGFPDRTLARGSYRAHS
jgi:hypothetical protein